MFKKLNWKKILLWSLGVFILFRYVLAKIFKPIGYFFELLGFNITQGGLNNQIANDTSGNGTGGVNESNRAQVCQDVAEKCQYAIHAYTKVGWWWVSRFDEDEPMVIKNLNRLVNASEAIIASNSYAMITAALKGRCSLKADVFEYLSATERSRINPVVLANLL